LEKQEEKRENEPNAREKKPSRAREKRKKPVTLEENQGWEGGRKTVPLAESGERARKA